MKRFSKRNFSVILKYFYLHHDSNENMKCHQMLIVTAEAVW